MGHLVYASTSAQVRAIRLGMCGDWCACVYVCVGACTETCEHVCVCMCECVCLCARAHASVRALVRMHAGKSMSAGCLCFSVRLFHFVLYA